MARTFDIRKKVIRIEDPKHVRHQRYLISLRRRARLRAITRAAASGVFLLLFLVLVLPSQLGAQTRNDEWTYEQQSAIQQVRIASLTRVRQLPVSDYDPKMEALAAYLREKQSPLARYAGELARMSNWKTLVGIAQAESNLCKKTQKNNCWGIGLNNTPERYNDISESMYYANYILSKYDKLGMDHENPETIVRTYVGYEHPGWVNTVRSVFLELAQRGLE